MSRTTQAGQEDVAGNEPCDPGNAVKGTALPGSRASPYKKGQIKILM